MKSLKQHLKQYLKQFNRKGQAIGMNMIDLILIFFSVVMAYLVVSLILFGGMGKAEKVSLERIGEFKRVDSAIRNIYLELYEKGDIGDVNIDEKIARSRILAGRTITNCQDYILEYDCTTDPIRVSKEGHCQWFRGELIGELNVCEELIIET